MRLNELVFADSTTVDDGVAASVGVIETSLSVLMTDD